MAERRALVIRHTPWEDIAGFGPPIEAAGYALEPVDVDDAAFATLDFDQFDLVIPLGGPMGVYQRERYPWIDGEIDRLSRRIAAGGPTLGVCFGAQMVAAAMGQEVYRGPTREVGFAPVTLTEAGRASPLRHVEEVPILHWHGDSFQFVLPQLAFVESVLHVLSLFQGGKTAQPNELVRVLNIKQRTEYFHSMRTQRRHCPCFEEFDKRVTFSWFDTIASDLNNHYNLPECLSTVHQV